VIILYEINLSRFTFTEERIDSFIENWKHDDSFQYLNDPEIQSGFKRVSKNYHFLEKYILLSEDIGNLFKFKSFLHGDFHNGNIFYCCNEEEFIEGIFN
jgi:hypothetical protein